jgi:DnaJ-class molecular chaperone
MINRSRAEAALVVLCIARTADTVLEHEVSGAFRAMAPGAHPDHGGTPEALHALTSARADLLEWIKQRGEAAVPGASAKCATCEGSGNIKVRRGFSAPMRRTCPSCRGTGAADYEHDLNAGRT